MVLRAGLEPARISPHAPQTCAATNYATSAIIFKDYFFPYFAGAFALATLVACLLNASVAGVSIKDPLSGCVFAGCGAGTLASIPAVFVSVVLAFALLDGASDCASGLLDRTETFPVRAGIDSNRAESMNMAAAPIVTFERTVAVPRGANAELETLLVKRAPASVLPGCKRTAATNTRQERKNSPYKK